MPVEGRDLSSRQTQDVGKDRRLGNLSTPKSVQRLQRALHAKAKAESGFRFYALYDKLYREDILAHAYARCRANKGAPGVDRQDFAAVEAYGVERWLGELALALREETYRPEPIKRVFIPKAPQGDSMKYTQTGSAALTTLITLVAIVAFLVVAIMLLPKGFSSDTSVIGQGSHVVVLAHNKDSVQSLTLMDLLNKVRSEYSSRIEFRVIDMNTPQGQAFLQQQQVQLGSLLFFVPDGTRQRVVSNIDDETELRASLNSIFN